MSRLPQVLTIDPPNEITFKGPFTDVVTSNLKLTNPSDKYVCFKVKTTAPKQYCVRPNSGLIPPSESVLVSVMLQPFDYNAEERNKHKFMVQTAFMPDGEHSLENIWKNTPQNEMMDSKLRVVFDLPADQLPNADKISVAKNSTQQQQQQSPSLITSIKPTSQNIEAEYRRVLDENKRYLHQLTQIEQENSQLRDRLKKVELGGEGGSNSSSFMGGGGSMVGSPERYTIMHLILSFIVAAFVGLILGKAF